MIAVDTNVLLRIFVADTPKQTAAVRRLIDGAREQSVLVFVSSLVLAELCWALKSIYRWHKRDMLEALQAILDNEVFLVAERDAAEIALDTWRTGKADFADYMIAAIARHAGAATTYTFDIEAAVTRPALTLLET
jgi:predicted nucleic-acid-binding protein